MNHVSVVVVHYNQPHYTRQCLASLAKTRNSGFKMTVLVVDNGSSQPFRLPKSLSPSKFNVIRSESNLGFTGGNNLGIHTAIERFNSDFILLLNNDTLVEPHFLSRMLKQFQLQPQVGVMSPLIYFSPGREFHKSSYALKDRGKVIWYAGGSLDWPNLSFFHRGVDEVDRGQFSQQMSTQFATGCAMLIRREVLEKCGFLDKKFFMYGEDVDFSLKAVVAGYQIGFCPSAKIWHINAGSTGGSGSDLQLYYQQRNRYLLGWRYGGWVAKYAMLGLQWQAIWSNSKINRLAVWHSYLGRWGKQPLW